MRNNNILLMGPIGVGKTSVGRELALRTGKRFVEMDEEKKRIYEQIGFSLQKCEEKYKKYGIIGWYQYQKPFELYSVKIVLEENDDAIVDFGGGHSVYDNEAQTREFLGLMRLQKHSFLLMPYEDVEKSLELLSKRNEKDDTELNRIFINSATSRQAAKHIIYIGEKTILEIVDEILKYIN